MRADCSCGVAAHHDDGAVGAGRHGQTDRAQQELLELAAPLEPVTSIVALCPSSSSAVTVSCASTSAVTLTSGLRTAARAAASVTMLSASTCSEGRSRLCCRLAAS